MSRLSKIMLHILLTQCMLIAASYSSCLAADHLKYPGNGFPHLSKNKQINDLNAEIQRQAESNKNITFSQNRMFFDCISEFKFSSSRVLIGPRFCLRVPLSIDHGSCAIRIGNVSYSVGHDGFRVTENGTVLFESEKDKPIDIIVEVFSHSNSSTRFHNKDRLLEIVNVSFSEPAMISMSLDDNCSGWIGPWEWLRGYE